MNNRKALSDLKKQLRDLPDDCGEAIFDLAKDFEKLGVRDKVVELFYRRAILAGITEAYAHLGELKENAGNLASALKWYLAAWRHGDPRGAFEVGLVLEKEGDLTRAFAAHRLASANYPSALYRMAIIRRDQGENQAAKAILRESAELSWEAAVDLALYYLELSDGIDLLERHKAKGNDDVDFALATLYKRAGRVAEQEAVLKQDADDGNVFAMTNLALMYDDQGKTAKAYKLWKRAAKLDDQIAVDQLDILVRDASSAETAERVAHHPFARIYDEYVDQVQSNKGAVADLRIAITWLTGYDEAGIDRAIADNVTLRDFFGNAPQINENVNQIKGKIYGIRIKKLKDPFIQNVRRLDKLVDDLAKGKELNAMLRAPVEGA